MTEEAVVVESKATPEQQAAAEKLGWIPPTRFKGDPARFVDADIYLERGETVLPIVKKQLADTRAELATVREQASANAAALKAAQDAIDQIEERHSVETQKAVEGARKQLKARLAQASEAGDHEAIAELTEQIVDLNAAEKAAPPIKKEEAKPAPFVPSPDLKEWTADNPWFGVNKRKTALALGIAQELRDAGEKSIGREFYDKVLAEVDKELGGKAAEPRGDKVEAGRNGSENETRSSAKKGYTALSADAKAACDADYKGNMKIKEKYKTIAEWRSRYAELYFGQES